MYTYGFIQVIHTMCRLSGMMHSKGCMLWAGCDVKSYTREINSVSTI